ncbi:hypothetical protein [Prauserella cavernicola]|uniref:Uncharacterized protein n=1 Tax=Prauserella cavernicola TaxID=2800127 RepID=A0A934V2A5_9PSEU|nr:hypothetical protein [Prauserella cavernicola]MBK1785171.1 hypothetical protein [Prauserella cavernicola]
MANGDGTQAPDPAQSFSDPLSGLVTSGRPDNQSTDERPERNDFTSFQLATPVEPDPDMVKGMVDAAMAGEQLPDQDAEDAPADDAVALPGAPPESGDDGPPGVYSRQSRGWAARTQLLPQMLRKRQEGREKAPKPEGERGLVRKPSNGSAGLLIALVLMAVFGIVAIQFISSLIESISSLFN